MARVGDVAEYILRARGPMTAMKLQRLVYYSQAWHLVWDAEPLFDNRIEAWANGPVVPDLYRLHRGVFGVEPGAFGGDPDALTPAERSTVDAVLDAYGDRSAHQLGQLTHREEPWRRARVGLHPAERGRSEITHAAMVTAHEGSRR